MTAATQATDSSSATDTATVALDEQTYDTATVLVGVPAYDTASTTDA
ncbi:hypothetical protein ABIA39_007441 [Nocardia sp. GAS34]